MNTLPEQLSAPQNRNGSAHALASSATVAGTAPATVLTLSVPENEPRMKACGACSGHGYDPIHFRRCSSCQGEREIQDGRTCRQCNGQTWQRYGCETCADPRPKIYHVVGCGPETPKQFPATIYWRDWNMPKQSQFAAWPPVNKPDQANSAWGLDWDRNLFIATTFSDASQFHSFCFVHWGLRPCGQSKVTERREADMGNFVIEQSNL